jgi:leucine-zipper of insertion element IS481
MHRNAPLTPEGRRRLCELIAAGWTVAAAAGSMRISRQCAHKWWRRYQAEGIAGLVDRSSRPKSCRTRRRRGWSGGSWRSVRPASWARPVWAASWGCIHRRCIASSSVTQESFGVDGPGDRTRRAPHRNPSLRRARPHRHQKAQPDPPWWRLASERHRAATLIALQASPRNTLRRPIRLSARSSSCADAPHQAVPSPRHCGRRLRPISMKRQSSVE